jgi:hypothetical protein
MCLEASQASAADGASSAQAPVTAARAATLRGGDEPQAKRRMIFPTVEFAIFFPIVLALSWALMPYPAVWKPFILVASYIFYGAAGWRFCILLAIVTLGNQAAARLLGRTDAPRARKAILAGALVLDLGVLVVFKYYGFFATEINGVLDAFGLGFSAPLVALAIPLGVSFFTFQAISVSAAHGFPPVPLIVLEHGISFDPGGEPDPALERAWGGCSASSPR